MYGEPHESKLRRNFIIATVFTAALFLAVVSVRPDRNFEMLLISAAVVHPVLQFLLNIKYAT
jgi:asparagine N-glycosylation enzyme membrane subunit Stt3